MPRPLAPALAPALALAILAASATATPAQCIPAQCIPAQSIPAQSLEELQLPERMDRALREMMDELKPALDDALDYMRSFGAIDDPRHYEMPEVLPNGDIIIRRSDDAPPFSPDDPEEEDTLPVDPEDGIRT